MNKILMTVHMNSVLCTMFYYILIKNALSMNFNVKIKMQMNGQ